MGRTAPCPPSHPSCCLPQVQPSNYCTFYDDQRQNWSLMFETEKAATDFCKEVTIDIISRSGVELSFYIVI